MTSEKDEEHVVAERLVAQISAGGDSATAARQELVNRYSRGLEMLLRFKCGDAELAKDLRQDTLLMALEKLPSNGPDEPHKLSAWLNGIAKNLLRGHRAKEARRKTDPAGDFAGIEPVDDEPPPAAALSNQEVRTIVQMVLDELSEERDRDILRRVFWQDQDAEVICAAWDTSRAQLSRILYRAKARFRELVLVAERRKGFHIVPSDE